MLARLLRLSLLFELFAYFFMGLLRVKLAGGTPISSLMLMILLALGWRAWAILLTYAVALANRSPLPVPCVAIQ